LIPIVPFVARGRVRVDFGASCRGNIALGTNGGVRRGEGVRQAARSTRPSARLVRRPG